MKRTAGACVLLAALGGCVTTGGGGPDPGAPWANPTSYSGGGSGAPPNVAGVQGPWGQPVAMAPPYSSVPSNVAAGTAAARAMINNSMPLELVQQAQYTQAGSGAGLAPVSGHCGPNGCLPGAVPPPGGMSPPGVPMLPGGGPPGAVAAAGALLGGPAAPHPFPAQRSEVRFVGPTGMKISWYAPGQAGGAGFGSALVAPSRYNFVQGAIYRLKLSDIPNRPALDLYPTLEVVPTNKKTEAFLAHSAVPVSFTEEDFEQVAAGNYVVKVIYLPDPQFQDLATTGPDEVVSSRLEPGVDPIAEACRRGSILLIVRLGNIDLEAPNTPAMDAPSPYQARPPVPHAMMPGMPMQGPAIPYVPGRGMMPAAGGAGLTGPGGPAGMLPPIPPNPATGTPVSKAAESMGVQQVQFRLPPVEKKAERR